MFACEVAEKTLRLVTKHLFKLLLLLFLDSYFTMDQQNQQPIESEEPIEIAFTGDLTDHESDLTQQLLAIPKGGACTLFFDSPGGSPYCAVSLMTIILLRDLDATGVVTGECSSAALWPFTACRHRFVTPFSVLLFHPMKWQSEEHIGLSEAAEWARHFGDLENDMDKLLSDLLSVDRSEIDGWISPGRYVSGREFAAAGFAKLIEVNQLRRVVAGRKQAGEQSQNGGTNGAGETSSRQVSRR